MGALKVETCERGVNQDIYQFQSFLEIPVLGVFLLLAGADCLLDFHSCHPGAPWSFSSVGFPFYQIPSFPSLFLVTPSLYPLVASSLLSDFVRPSLNGLGKGLA